MSRYFHEMTTQNLYGINVQHYFQDRTFTSSGKIFADFCSTNYLGIDYREELITNSTAFLRQWGSLTQWARLEADCNIYTQLESIIAEMLGYQDIYFFSRQFKIHHGLSPQQYRLQIKEAKS